MKTYLAVGFTAALTACAGTDSTRMGRTDAAAYRSTALQISSTATAYDSATSTMTTPADCTAALQDHVAQMQPLIQQMGELAGPMDGAMESMGRMTNADMECGFTAMQQEMQQYMAIACGAPDVASIRALAQQHVAAMQTVSSHMQMRADEMVQLMGGTAQGGMMQGGAMQGGTGQGGMMQGAASGSAATTGAWTMPGGGMMSWDDAMPGCQLVNGTFQPTASGMSGTSTSAPTTSGGVSG